MESTSEEEDDVDVPKSSEPDLRETDPSDGPNQTSVQAAMDITEDDQAATPRRSKARAQIIVHAEDEPEEALPESESTRESFTSGCIFLQYEETDSRMPVTDWSARELLRRDGFVPMLRNEPPDLILRRSRAYAETWAQLQKSIQKLQLSIHAEVFNQVSSFVGSLSEQRFYEGEIPTALLLAGVNLGDHRDLFHQLVKHLDTSLHLPLTTLRMARCTELKAAIKQLVRGFMGPDCKQEVQGRWKLQRLVEWKAKLAKKPARLLVLFEDFESGTPKVLRDVIQVCSNYQQDLSFVFLLPLATSFTETLRNSSLPRSVSQLLRLERFHLEPSSHFLDRFVSEVLITGSLPVRMTGEILDLLLANFHYWNISVSKLTQALHFVVLDHFYSNPLSMFCAPDPPRVKLTPEHYEFALGLGSLANKDMTSSQLQAIWEEWVQELRHHHVRFPTVFHIFYQFVSFGRPQGPQYFERNVYASCLATGHRHAECRNQYLTPALQRVYPMAGETVLSDTFDLPQLRRLIDAWLLLLDKADFPGENSARDVSNLRILATKLATASDPDPAPADPESSFISSHNTLGAGARRKSLISQEITRSQSESATARRPRRREELTPLRKELRIWLDDFFATYLPPPDTFPLYELFYFQKEYLLSSCMYPAHESLVESDFVRAPKWLFGQSGAAAQPGTLSADLPDACILYILQQREKTKLINLKDWLDSFVEVVKPRMESSEQTYWRFVQAVTELQMFGMIKTTKRKTDHVSKTNL